MAKSQKKSPTLTIRANSLKQSAKEKNPAPAKKSTKSFNAKKADAIAESSTKSAPNSKQEILIALMRRAEGATIEDLISSSGWQRHSIRGVISGVLKKRLGFTIESSSIDGVRMYRITGERR